MRTKTLAGDTVRRWMIQEGKRARRNRAAYVFITPFFLLFIVFTVLPVLMSIFYSFTDYNMLEAPDWVGVSNYVRLAVKDDISSKP